MDDDKIVGTSRVYFKEWYKNFEVDLLFLADWLRRQKLAESEL
jgi:hypothetical protein